MEKPALSIETPTQKIINKKLFNKDVILNDSIFDFSINKIDDNKISFIVSNKDIGQYMEYKKELTLENFKNINKYFKMFETLDELVNDLISRIKENNIEIEKQSDNVISLKFKIVIRTDNIIIINLVKVEIKEKEKINILFDIYKEFKKNLDIKDDKIKQLENEISLIKQNNEFFKKNLLDELNKKEKMIQYFEKEINEFKNMFNTLKNDISQKNEKSNNIMSFNFFENILTNSNIFQDSNEILLIISNIPNIPYNQNNLTLIYNSKSDGENEEKLIDAYTNKNDLIILVKTDKLRRFGGYAHESFEKYKFKKTDKSAFLFNLNKKKIYKSKGNERSIWRGSNTFDSINFGNGVDLKIFHKFFKKQSKTHQGNNDYDYKNEDYALNGDESFNISSLEIYQVLLNK